jgi:hypothetical protein
VTYVHRISMRNHGESTTKELEHPSPRVDMSMAISSAILNYNSRIETNLF